MRVGRYCIVCGKSNKENIETLFRFPKDVTRKQQWKDILHVSSDLKFTSRVCQNHFTKDQFIRDRLKKNAIPTRKKTESSDNVHTVAPRFTTLQPKTLPFW